MTASRGSYRRRGTSADPKEPGKIRITIRLDGDVLAWFRKQVNAGGGGSYQTLINLALRDHITREPLEATLRRVVREELARADGRSLPHAYGYASSPAALVADSDIAEYGRPPAAQVQPRARKRRRD